MRDTGKVGIFQTGHRSTGECGLGGAICLFIKLQESSQSKALVVFVGKLGSKY